jgi:hypothetical protein
VRRPGLVLGGLLAAVLACGSAPGPGATVSPARTDAPEVPLRDTSGDIGVAPLPENTRPAERWLPRTVEGPPAAPAHGRLIDLDARDADIQDVCRLLADVGGVNIVAGDDVHGKVTVRMKRVPWDQALDAIAETKGLRVVREGNVVLVKPAGK